MTPPASSDDDDDVLAELGDALDAALDDLAPVSESDVRPVRLGAETHQAAVPLAGLDRIGERAARGLRAVLEPYIRVRPKIVAAPLETNRFEGWRGALEPFVALFNYRSPAVKSGFLLSLEPQFLTRLVDVFYGGAGSPATVRAKEFTPGEDRVAVRLADEIMQVMAAAWAEMIPLDPVLLGRETSREQTALVRGDELIVLQRFDVDAGPAGTTRIDLVYPIAALKAHPALTGGRPATEASPEDRRFRAALAEALGQVQLPVRSVLARPELSVDALLALKPGDVIPISLGPRVPLLVANRRVAEGTIGEQEGRAALMIELVGNDA